MSAPQVNPDPRPLPAGWVTRYEPRKQAWFYIDTSAQPPVASWQHPLGPLAPTPSQDYYQQPHKPSGLGVPSHPGYGGPAPPHDPYSKPYNPHQSSMTPSFHPTPNPSQSIQPPQQAYPNGPTHAPGSYSNYGTGHNQAHGHGGNHNTAQAQQQPAEEKTGCFSGLCQTASKNKGLIKTFMKEGFKLIKKHLMNQSDTSDNQPDSASQLNDKVVQLNAAYEPDTQTNGYGDQGNRY